MKTYKNWIGFFKNAKREDWINKLNHRIITIHYLGMSRDLGYKVYSLEVPGYHYKYNTKTSMSYDEVSALAREYMDEQNTNEGMSRFA